MKLFFAIDRKCLSACNFSRRHLESKVLEVGNGGALKKWEMEEPLRSGKWSP